MHYPYQLSDIEAAIASAKGAPATDLTYLGEGMDSVAYLVDGDTVFRFPKAAEIAASSLVERDILPIIANAVDIAVPQPRYFGRIQPSNLPFFGYPLLQGTFLSEFDAASFTAQENEALAQSHANFVRQMHAIPVATARAANVPELIFPRVYEQDWEKAQQLLFPLISAELRTFLTNTFEAYFTLAAQDSYTPTLLHGDIASDHILVDPATKRMIGIIDFGDIHIGDPVYDLHWYGDPAPTLWQQRLLDLLPAYSNAKSDAKRRFFYAANFTQDFIFGVEDNLPATIAYGHDNLKRLAALQD